MTGRRHRGEAGYDGQTAQGHRGEVDCTWEAAIEEADSELAGRDNVVFKEELLATGVQGRC